MTLEPAWLCLAPPVLTIALALATRRVLPSLFAGVLAGHLILSYPNLGAAPFAVVNQLLDVATDRGNLIIIVFSLAVGGLLSLIRTGGGFDAFAAAIERARPGYGKGTAYSLTSIVGVGMFLEVWSSVLVNGATSGPLYDRLGLSRARLAYFAHTISICIVAMLVINSWGAFYIGLLNAQGVARPFSFIVGSVPYMIYSWASLALVAAVMASGLSIGPMRKFDAAAREGKDKPFAAREQDAERLTHARVVYMAVPLAVLMATVFAALYLTGDGDIINGDGGLAILYGVLAASAIAGALLIVLGRVAGDVVERRFTAGMAKFLDVGLLIVLALAIGQLARMMGAGAFIAEIMTATLPVQFAPALIFLAGALISFSTGTSYGTFAILTPIALSVAGEYAISPMLMFGAVISGGLFGDNASPISDTTIMTAIGAEIPVIDHARTQLTYALIAAALAFAGFLVLGALM